MKDAAGPWPETRPRRAWVAGLLAALFMGLGHLYVGRPRAAWLLMALPPFTILAALVAPVASDRGAVAAILGTVGLYGAIWVAQIVWAVVVARGTGARYVLRPCNRNIVYVGFVVASVCVSVVVGTAKQLVIGAYRLPSRSMAPTLLVGDRVLVTRLAEADRTPRRGDLIVYVYPKDRSKDSIKRVVGMPGDFIEIVDKTVLVNGEPYTVPGEVHDDPITFPADKNPRDNLAPLRVPLDNYFVLGDNRDHSLDSRFLGPVPRSDLRGRVRAIYWSWGGDGVRWERIGRVP
jgi:signal peptidase I